MGAPALEDEAAGMRRFGAVIGTVNFDRVVGESGEVYESLGGILYNGLVLAHLLEGSGVGIRLVARLGAEHREEACRLFDGFSGVDLRGLLADPHGTNLSRLDWSRGPERHERVELRVPPLFGEDLRGVEEADVVLVNMISGRDVDRDALAGLRARSRARFLLDVQALARTLESPRRPRAVPEGRRWAELFHTVRGNEAEIAALAGLGTGEASRDDAARAAAVILSCGPSEVFVTRGEAGSVRFTNGARGLRAQNIEAVPRPGEVDSTGCGDAYDAALAAGACFGLDGFDAGRLGSFVGSEVAGVRGLEGVRALRGLRERAVDFDPRFAVVGRRGG